MTVYFTSDQHFGHARILELCGRPFASVEEMDETMIVRWNAVVQPTDTVWHLGDFTMGSVEMAWRYRARLNGRVNLIHGNHDRESVRNSGCMWHISAPMAQINHQGRQITLCHYAMRTWDQSHRGALMLYGHAHGRLPGTRLSLDVGVDCWDFTPVTLDQILARMATLPEEYSGSHRIIQRERENPT